MLNLIYEPLFSVSIEILILVFVIGNENDIKRRRKSEYRKMFHVVNNYYNCKSCIVRIVILFHMINASNLKHTCGSTKSEERVFHVPNSKSNKSFVLQFTKNWNFDSNHCVYWMCNEAGYVSIIMAVRDENVTSGNFAIRIKLIL